MHEIKHDFSVKTYFLSGDKESFLPVEGRGGAFVGEGQPKTLEHLDLRSS